jgi:hypothetical protein
MQYAVLTVAEDELPEGVQHVIVERPEPDPPLLIITGETARCWEFMRRWEDTLEPSSVPTVTRPYLRAVG